MSDRNLVAMVAMLTAVIRVRLPELDGDASVMQAISLAHGGMGETELVLAMETVLRGWQSPGQGFLRPAAEEILVDVEFALGMRGALR